MLRVVKVAKVGIDRGVILRTDSLISSPWNPRQGEEILAQAPGRSYRVTGHSSIQGLETLVHGLRCNED